MDQQLVLAVEEQDDDLEQTTCVVEAVTELSSRAVLVEVAKEDRVFGGVDGFVGSDAAMSSGTVDYLHSKGYGSLH